MREPDEYDFMDDLFDDFEDGTTDDGITDNKDDGGLASDSFGAGTGTDTTDEDDFGIDFSGGAVVDDPIVDEPDDQGNGSNDGGGEGEGGNEIEVTDIMSKLLADRGIEDPSKIKYENDNGEIEEVDFYDLPLDEQYAILNSTTNADTDDGSNYGLNEHETEVVNYLRTNNATLDQVIEHFQSRAVEDYIRDSALKGFGIDTVSDEELFKLDLKANYEDLTDAEIDTQLQKELEHKDFFDKKVNKLRQEYLEAEAAVQEQEEQKRLEEEQNKYDTLANELIEVARDVDEIGGLDLSDEDKEEVLSFVLDRDNDGSSNLGKILNDTDSLFKLAWYAVKGEQAFEVIHDYYKKEIEKARKQQTKPRPRTTTVIRKTKTSKGSTADKGSRYFNSDVTLDDLSYD